MFSNTVFSKKIPYKKILSYTLKGFFIVFVIGLFVLMGALGWGYYLLSPSVEKYLEETVESQSDSLYKLRIETLKINLLSGKIWVKNVHFEPNEKKWKEKFSKNQAPSLAKIFVKEIEVNNWSWWDYYWYKKLNIGQIYLEKPDIFYQKPAKNLEKEDKKPIFDEKIIEKIAKHWEIKDIFIRNADISFKVFQKEFVWTHVGKNLHLHTQNITFGNKKWRLKSFKGGFKRYTAHTPKGDYIFHAENLDISSLDSTLSLNFFKIIPADKPEEAIKFGFKQLKFTGLQYFDIWEQQKLSFKNLKCKEVEAIFPKIPKVLTKNITENATKSKKDTLKKYNFLSEIPFTIAWDTIQGEKINLYMGNWDKKNQNYPKTIGNFQDVMPISLHYYKGKNLKIMLTKGLLDREKSILPKELQVFAEELAYQKNNQVVEGKNLVFSWQKELFFWEKVLFFDENVIGKNIKKVQFGTEKISIKGFPHIDNIENAMKGLDLWRFRHVSLQKTKVEWVAQMAFQAEKPTFRLEILPNMQIDTLQISQITGNLSPYPYVQAKVAKAHANIYQLRKQQDKILFQDMEIWGEGLCFRNQNTKDTLYAKYVHFKKNPATLTLEEWAGGVTWTKNEKHQQLYIKGEKNIIQLKNFDEFITQKKWHFAYIYAKNIQFSFLANQEVTQTTKEILQNENPTNENQNRKIQIKPITLPAPIEIDSLIIEKNRTELQWISHQTTPNFTEGNTKKNTHLCKEINAKILHLQIEKEFSLEKLYGFQSFSFDSNSSVEILDYKGDFEQQGHQITAKKVVFAQENKIQNAIKFLAENVQVKPYQENYVQFFQKNPQSDVFVQAEIQFLGLENFLRTDFSQFSQGKMPFLADLWAMENAKATVFIKTKKITDEKFTNKENTKNEIKRPFSFKLDTFQSKNVTLEISYVAENIQDIHTKFNTKADILAFGLGLPLQAKGFLNLQDTEFQSKDLCLKIKQFNFNSFSKIALFKDIFIENQAKTKNDTEIQKSNTFFAFFTKNLKINNLDIPTWKTDEGNALNGQNINISVNILDGFLNLKNTIELPKKENSHSLLNKTPINKNPFEAFEKILKNTQIGLKIDTISAQNIDFSFQKEHLNKANDVFLNEQSMKIEKIAFFNVFMDTLLHTPKAKNIDLSIKNYQSDMDFGLYKSSIKSISANSLSKNVVLEDIVVNPIFSPEIVAYHRGKQTDIWETAFGKIETKGWNWDFMQEKMGFKANTVAITNANYMMYKDKRRALPDKPATMLNERWQKITFPIQIDTLSVLKNAFFYTEFAPKAGTETGHIYFSDIQGKIFPLYNQLLNNTQNPILDTTQKTQILLDGKLMGEGQVDLQLETYLNQKTFLLTGKGRLGKIEATIFNMFLENTQHIRIKKGHIKEIRFDMEMQQSHAIGTLHASYKRLYVQVLGKKNIEKKRRFISFLANLIIKNRNNAERKHARVGKIDYKKLPHEGFGLFFGKSIGTGIKDTLK